MAALGVRSIQNFWLLLKSTWINTIKSQLPREIRPSYIKHIEKREKTPQTILIDSEEKLMVFFSTLSFVFGFQVHLNFIDVASHSTKVINSRKLKNNRAKYINVRKFNQEFMVEPWINEVCLYEPDQV